MAKRNKNKPPWALSSTDNSTHHPFVCRIHAICSRIICHYIVAWNDANHRVIRVISRGKIRQITVWFAVYCFTHYYQPRHAHTCFTTQLGTSCVFDSSGLAKNEPTPGKLLQGDSTPFPLFHAVKSGKSCSYPQKKSSVSLSFSPPCHWFLEKTRKQSLNYARRMNEL